MALGSGGENRHKIPFRPILVDSAVPTRLRRLDRQKSEWKKRSHPEVLSSRTPRCRLLDARTPHSTRLDSCRRSSPRPTPSPRSTRWIGLGPPSLFGGASDKPGVKATNHDSESPPRINGARDSPSWSLDAKFSNSCGLNFRGTPSEVGLRVGVPLSPQLMLLAIFLKSVHSHNSSEKEGELRCCTDDSGYVCHGGVHMYSQYNNLSDMTVCEPSLYIGENKHEADTSESTGFEKLDSQSRFIAAIASARWRRGLWCTPRRRRR